jgi:hypothetical protein
MHQTSNASNLAWRAVAQALTIITMNVNIINRALVASVATAEEKVRIQGVAERAATSLVALASLFSSGLHSHFGWNILILAGCVPFVTLTCGLEWSGINQRKKLSRES